MLFYFLLCCPTCGQLLFFSVLLLLLYCCFLPILFHLSLQTAAVPHKLRHPMICSYYLSAIFPFVYNNLCRGLPLVNHSLRTDRQPVFFFPVWITGTVAFRLPCFLLSVRVLPENCLPRAHARNLTAVPAPAHIRLRLV